MAGPPQLNDPRLKQFSEAGSVTDTSAAELTEGLANVGQTLLTTKLKSDLRSEVADQRERFLTTIAEAEELGVEPEITQSPDDNELLEFDVPAVIESTIDDDTITMSKNEVLGMAQEVDEQKRAVVQGMLPTRALEINVEAITRRYIDRYPGLTTEFQRVAQVALGTDSNLLASTMNYYEQEMNRARTEVEEQQSQLAALAVDAGFIGAISDDPMERAEALQRFKAYSDTMVKDKMLEVEESIAKRKGQPTRAQRATTQRLQGYNAMNWMEARNNIADITGQLNWVEDPGSLWRGLDPTKEAELMFRIDATKTAHLNEARELMEANISLDDSNRARMNAYLDELGSLYDSFKESVTNKALTEPLEYYLRAMQAENERAFETVLGRQRVFSKHILAMIADGNLQNKWFEVLMTRGPEGNTLLTAAEFLGSTEEEIRSLGFNPSEEREVRGAIVSGTVEGYLEFIGNPTDPVYQGFNPAGTLRFLENTYHDLSEEEKRRMFQALTDRNWHTRMNSLPDSAPEKATMVRISKMAQEWGEGVILSTVAQLDAQMSDIQLTSRTNYGTEVTVRDLVDVSLNNGQLSVTPVSDAELKALGLNPGPWRDDARELANRIDRKLLRKLNTYIEIEQNIPGRGGVNVQYIHDMLKGEEEESAEPTAD